MWEVSSKQSSGSSGTSSLKTNMRVLLNLLMMMTALGCVSGCGTIGTTEVVLVPESVDVDGVPYVIIRLGEDIRAHVYVKKDGKLIRSANKVTIHQGWLLMPPRVK